MSFAIVGSRVDALTMAYRVDLDKSVIEALDRCREVTREHGRSAVFIPLDAERSPVGAAAGLALWGEMRYTRAAKTWNVQNPEYRARIDLKATGGIVGEKVGEEEVGEKSPGWTLEVIFAAQALAAMPNVGKAVRMGKALAMGLGFLYEQRVRRFDLAVDLSGWEIGIADAVALVKKSAHAKQKQHGARDFAIDEDGTMQGEEIAISPDVHEVRRITGISVCPGGDLMLRLYDKPLELRMRPASTLLKKGADAAQRETEKAEIERARWIENGWDGVAPIVRTEFQVRGEAVRDFGVRNPEVWIDPVTRQPPREPAADGRGAIVRVPLEDTIDGIWQRCLSWCRLVDRASNVRATRCAEDERWKILRTATFVRRAAGEASRRRFRGGASVEQAMGCALSLLGARDELRYKVTDAPPLPPSEMTEAVRHEVLGIFGLAGEAAAAHLCEKWGPRKAYEHISVVNNAVLARFCAEPAQLSA